MCQRVALATAQAAEAPLLLADEANKGLDAALRDGMAERLRAEVAGGRACWPSHMASDSPNSSVGG